MSLWISAKRQKEEELIDFAENVNEEDYEVYDPLLAGLKTHE